MKNKIKITILLIINNLHLVIRLILFCNGRFYNFRLQFLSPHDLFIYLKEKILSVLSFFPVHIFFFQSKTIE